MKIIAHRGSANLAPENSLRAIKLSKSLNVDSIEIDVRLTSDNHLVVFHDKTLLRLGNRVEALSSLTLDEVTKIKLKNGEFIPSLRQVLEAVESTPLVIEGKDTGWAALLSDELKSYEYKDTLEVISFNETELAQFKKLNPEILSSILGILGSFKALRIAKRNNFNGIGFFFLGLNPFVYSQAKKYNLKIKVYTLNNVLLTRLVKILYPKVEIITDNPKKLQAVAKKNN